MGKFTFIDLFAGIGGFRLGLNNIGGECLNFSEKDKDAIQTYCLNYQEDSSFNLGDITKIKELKSHDLLTGGVPCQSWSIAGKQLGFDDDRGQLWNDTIYLLNQSKPKAFMFENVKGLVDPRNKEAFDYILKRIQQAGYHANFYLINSYDYGVAQARVRVYLIGFKEENFLNAFKLPEAISDKDKKSLAEILEIDVDNDFKNSFHFESNSGFTNYFMFNDLRNGEGTIHSWDIMDTTEKQKEICMLLLKNRRKKIYGPVDGNPLSLKNFQSLKSDVTKEDLIKLVELKILKEEKYEFKPLKKKGSLSNLNESELIVFTLIEEILKKKESFLIDEIKSHKELKKKNIKASIVMEKLMEKKMFECIETRYDFKNTKISTGINGINRIFLPSANIFPTLVASDSNDYIATEIVEAKNAKDFKELFIENIYKKGKYRKLSKEEACKIQGFPKDFKLPENRARWMKLIGNSVSVPVIEKLGQAIINTGVFKK